MTRSTRNIAFRPELTSGRFSSACIFIGRLFFDLAAAMSACHYRFVKSLHETRRRQAIEIIRRNRDLMCETGSGDPKDTRDNAE